MMHRCVVVAMLVAAFAATAAASVAVDGQGARRILATKPVAASNNTKAASPAPKVAAKGTHSKHDVHDHDHDDHDHDHGHRKLLAGAQGTLKQVNEDDQEHGEDHDDGHGHDHQGHNQTVPAKASKLTGSNSTRTATSMPAAASAHDEDHAGHDHDHAGHNHTTTGARLTGAGNITAASGPQTGKARSGAGHLSAGVTGLFGALAAVAVFVV